VADGPPSGRPPQPASGQPGPFAGEQASPFRADVRKPFLERVFPVLAQLPQYPKLSLRKDLVAGVTVAALALPSGMAYAQLAGLSPVAGLYALLLPVVAYVFLGSSRQLVIGPEGALAVMTATALAPLAAGDPKRYAQLAAVLALMTGGIYLLARVIRLGWLADYFSRAVLVGYLHGVAVILVIGQLGKLFGLSIKATDPLPQIKEFVQELAHVHGLTVAVSAACFGVLVLLRWRWPRVPAPLVIVIGGIVASWALNLASHGVAVVGHIPPGLPSLHIPQVPGGDLARLVPDALGLFAVGFADGILTARSFAGRHGQHVRANQELTALGMANVAGGFTQAFPVGASGSRTAVNDQMGGRTQFVGLVSAAVIAVILLVLTKPVEYLPKACLGAVIVMAGLGLIDPGAWRSLAAAGRREVAIAAITTIGVVAVGVLEALIVAVVLSVIDVIARTARPHDAVLGWVERLGRYADASVHPSARITPGVVIYRLDEQLVFTNASYAKSRIQEAVAGAPTPTHFVVFDAEGVSNIDGTGVEMIEELVTALQHDHITLVFARLKTSVAERFEATGLTELIGADHFYGNVEAAVVACE
jgi:SulP family sulfate permease